MGIEIELWVIELYIIEIKNVVIIVEIIDVIIDEKMLFKGSINKREIILDLYTPRFNK